MKPFDTLRRLIKRRVVKATIFFVFTIVFLGLFAGDFLVINEKPQKSDAIIVLSGGQNNLDKGIELFNQGYAPFLLLSNALDDGMISQIKAAKVSNSSIILETKADSTYTNALYTKNLMVQHHLNSAIIVSPDYHMRRVKFHFEKIYKGTEIKFTYSPVETQDFHPHFWWLDRNSTKIVFGEYVKFVGNLFGIEGNEYKEYLSKILIYFFR